MKFAIAAIAVLALVATVSALGGLPQLSADQHDSLFNAYKAQHNKIYSGDEEELVRFSFFIERLEFIRQYNAENEAQLAINHLSDRTPEEYEQMLGYKAGMQEFPATHVAEEGASVPSTVDWRSKGVVTPVKNQGQCGSCWSFSTTGSVEGAHAIATGNLVSLSEQQLVDCSGSYGNMGCQGGLMTSAFQYIIDNKGDSTEASYPYQAVEGTCSAKSGTLGATISSYKNVTSGSESDLQDAVANVGPVSVAIDANHPEFMNYHSGVLNIPSCSSTQLDHGVLVVGYGTSAGSDYWLVKNSWTPQWGMDGYVMMSRNKNNQCGIATMASYPIV